MINVIIKKSTNNNNKFDAYFTDKKISFGAAGYSDFTIHKDPERKNRYIERHKKMKIGTTLKQPVVFHGLFYGINQQ